ncbi:MAG: hypothetical protein JOZ01_02155 [Candidatus Eremiobacteraeota bacterium]|nr:hypothetical protein [Candidatus Eremiobacteraeota bacterium]
MIHLILAAVLTHVDVLISAGHEGRPASCARYPKRACNLGAAGEREWTPIVADEAARVLRTYGVTVAREPADFDGSYAVDAAIFIHFDGSTAPCSSAASIGYHEPRFRKSAQRWRDLYSEYFPFGFQPDNFTKGRRDYYAYRQVHAKDASLVLELGELTCAKQRAWIQPRLQFEGQLIAYFLSELIGKGDVPRPVAKNGGHASSAFLRTGRARRAVSSLFALHSSGSR